MSREIKFRAWDKKTKTLSHNILDARWAVYFDDYERVILMQYTGLKDKNGKEIYEGDIIQLISLDEEQTKTNYEVKLGVYENMFGDKVFGIYTWIDDDNGNDELCVQELNESEVIGNIYENPELLEEI